jgi:hypothetical protein
MDCFCTSICQQEPSSKILSTFENLDKSRLPDQSKSFAEEVFRELTDYSTQTIEFLRWRGDIRGPRNPFRSAEMKWSYDSKTWKPIPPKIEVTIHTSPLFCVTHPILEEILNLVKKRTLEPLGYKLFLEAWQQKDKNPRSSIVIGIAAAEVGFKQFVTTLVPEVQWILENLQTPPLVMMLKKYLPEITTEHPIQRKLFPPPPAIMKTLEKGIKLRNKITHTTTRPPKPKKLKEILLAVHDLLRILDYYLGFDWAIEYVRPEIRKAMKLEDI